MLLNEVHELFRAVYQDDTGLAFVLESYEYALGKELIIEMVPTGIYTSGVKSGDEYNFRVWEVFAPTLFEMFDKEPSEQRGCRLLIGIVNAETAAAYIRGMEHALNNIYDGLAEQEDNENV